MARKLAMFLSVVATLGCMTILAYAAELNLAHSERVQAGGSIGVAESLVALEARMDSMEAENAALRALLAGVSRGMDPNTGQDTLRFANMNVQIVSGSGATDDIINGRGNLIIGYNELRTPDDERTGSHMLVIGRYNNYAAFGGMVAGTDNSVYAQWASISGGSHNTASGAASSVSGGYNNTASSMWSSTSGGAYNMASGSQSSVSGGYFNEASGDKSTVSGGARLTAATSLCLVGDGQLSC